MHYVGSRNPQASIPLFSSAAEIMRPLEPLPHTTALISHSKNYLPPHEQELLLRELANAEVALADMMNALAVARAGIGQANKTSTRRSCPAAEG